MNILLLKALKQHYHVTYDRQDRDGVFKVNTKNGVVELIPHKSGFHMIRKNFEGYAKKQVEGTIKACPLQAMLGHHLREDFECMAFAYLIPIVQ